MPRFVSRLARLAFRDYSIYGIFCNDRESARAVARDEHLRVVNVDASAIDIQRNELLRDQSWYAGQDSLAYACLHAGRMVGLCFYWYGERYRQRNFWPLAEHEAKLVQIITLPEARGRGFGRALIAESFIDVTKRGFDRAYARVWHSNVASRRAFENAGWKRVAFAVDLHARGIPKPLRLRIRA